MCYASHAIRCFQRSARDRVPRRGASPESEREVFAFGRTVRATKKTEFIPDVSFISRERHSPLKGDDREKPPFAPEIAVEVRSPSDDLTYLQRKIERCLANGSVLVLDIDPKTRAIHAYTRDGMREFREGERFTTTAVPWLEFDVSETFAQLP